MWSALSAYGNNVPCAYVDGYFLGGGLNGTPCPYPKEKHPWPGEKYGMGAHEYVAKGDWLSLEMQEKMRYSSGRYEGVFFEKKPSVNCLVCGGPCDEGSAGHEAFLHEHLERYKRWFEEQKARALLYCELAEGFHESQLANGWCDCGRIEGETCDLAKKLEELKR